MSKLGGIGNMVTTEYTYLSGYGLQKLLKRYRVTNLGQMNYKKDSKILGFCTFNAER